MQEPPPFTHPCHSGRAQREPETRSHTHRRPPPLVTRVARTSPRASPVEATPCVASTGGAGGGGAKRTEGEATRAIAKNEGNSVYKSGGNRVTHSQ